MILSPITRITLRVAEMIVSAIDERISQLEKKMSVTTDSITAALGKLTTAEQSVADAVAANSAELTKLAGLIVNATNQAGGPSQSALNAIAQQIQDRADALNTLAQTLTAADAAADASITQPLPAPAPSPSPAPTPAPAPVADPASPAAPPADNPPADPTTGTQAAS